MSVANLLYDRPDLNQGLNRPPLTLTGVLSRARPGEAYSGFLSIGNGIGNSAVIATSGDLPNGTAVVVNNTTQRVEVSWPAYVPPTSGGEVVSVDVPNGNFEQGDVFWQKGAGWTIDTGASESPETRAGLYTGPKTSVMWHAGAFPTRGGNTVRLRLRASGNESGNSSSCQAIVAFYGASGFISQDWSEVGADENFFEWDDFSTVAPEGALYYHIGVIGTKRRYSPRPATVDRVLLDATANTDTPDIGINIEVTLDVTISIQDDADRIATWSGQIPVLSVRALFGWDDSGHQVYYNLGGWSATQAIPFAAAGEGSLYRVAPDTALVFTDTLCWYTQDSGITWTEVASSTFGTGNQGTHAAAPFSNGRALLPHKEGTLVPMWDAATKTIISSNHGAVSNAYGVTSDGVTAAMMGANNGSYWYTTDSATSWTRVYIPNDGAINIMSCRNPLYAFGKWFIWDSYTTSEGTNPRLWILPTISTVPVSQFVHLPAGALLTAEINGCAAGVVGGVDVAAWAFGSGSGPIRIIYTDDGSSLKIGPTLPNGLSGSGDSRLSIVDGVLYYADGGSLYSITNITQSAATLVASGFGTRTRHIVEV